MGLLDDLPRGVREKNLDQFTGYEARFMDAGDFQQKFGLCQLGYSPHTGRGLMVGMADNGLHVGVEDDRHAMLFAGSRSNKGVSVIIPNLLFSKSSMLVLDPKGENAEITARQRVRMGQTVRILDPFNVVSNVKARYNPLAGLKPDSKSLIADVGLIGDACVMRTGHEAHWDDTSQTLIEAATLHVVTHPAYEDWRNLATVRRLLTHGTTYTTADGKHWTGMAGLFKEMEENAAARGVVQAASFEMQDRSEGEADGVLSTARRHTRFLDLPELQDVLKGHDFDLADLKRTPLTVYLCVPASHLGQCARWMRIFINQTLAAMERRDIPKPALPVRIVLDEMAILGHMRQLEDAIGQMAGFGLQIFGILQDMTQLRALYQERWESFLGNSGIIQFFANSDLTTLEWVSKRLGKTTIEKPESRELTQNDYAQGLTGTTRGQEVVDLLAPDEVARLFARSDAHRRCLVLQPDTRPLILQRYVYYEDALFQGLYDRREL